MNGCSAGLVPGHTFRIFAILAFVGLRPLFKVKKCKKAFLSFRGKKLSSITKFYFKNFLTATLVRIVEKLRTIPLKATLRHLADECRTRGCAGVEQVTANEFRRAAPCRELWITHAQCVVAYVILNFFEKRLFFGRQKISTSERHDRLRFHSSSNSILVSCWPGATWFFFLLSDWKYA